jgi:alcohol dehydrogenase class IV
MQEFDYQLRPRIVFGSGVINRLGTLARELNCVRALVVSDPGVVNAGLYEAGRQLPASNARASMIYQKTRRIRTSKKVAKWLARFDLIC